MTLTDVAPDHEALRDAYDDGIEALANEFAEVQSNGFRCWTEHSGGFWPYMLIEGRAGPHQVLSFRGFHVVFHLIIPRERFDAFFEKALAYLESYPADAYGKGDGQA